jgi:hypothetical protein
VSLPGSNWLKRSLNSLIKFTDFITANFSGLTIALFIFVIYAEQCMTGFDLPYNFNPNSERIERIVRHGIVPSQKKLSLGQHSTTPASSPMAQKRLHQFLAPSSSHIPTGLNTDQGNEGLF